jgi:membrane protein DedA with SNARE-associated domain
MTLEAFLAQFGYPALAVGVLLEGETFLIIGAFMAHRGYLDLPAVIGVAFLATLLADQFFFWLGHTHAPRSWRAARHGNRPWRGLSRF